MNFSINEIIYWVICFIVYWILFNKLDLLDILCKKEFNDITDMDDPKFTGGLTYVLRTPRELLAQFCEFYSHKCTLT